LSSAATPVKAGSARRFRRLAASDIDPSGERRALAATGTSAARVTATAAAMISVISRFSCLWLD